MLQYLNNERLEVISPKSNRLHPGYRHNQLCNVKELKLITKFFMISSTSSFGASGEAWYSRPAINSLIASKGLHVGNVANHGILSTATAEPLPIVVPFTADTHGHQDLHTTNCTLRIDLVFVLHCVDINIQSQHDKHYAGIVYNII